MKDIFIFLERLSTQNQYSPAQYDKAGSNELT